MKQIIYLFHSKNNKQIQLQKSTWDNIEQYIIGHPPRNPHIHKHEVQLKETESDPEPSKLAKQTRITQKRAEEQKIAPTTTTRSLYFHGFKKECSNLRRTATFLILTHINTQEKALFNVPIN